jgi:2-polyprenyl-3-methyl-5-hydroxy-6-metoxy-1,4-benzoquinol methylase
MHDTPEMLPDGDPRWPEAEELYGYVRRVLARVSPPPCALLDLGAAPGAQSVALARAGYRVTAVDLGEASDEWGNQPAGTMAAAFERTGVELVVWDLAKVPYPFAGETFDVVLLTEVLEHLRDYPLLALKEARRILKPGGYLLLTTPNAASLQNRARLMLGRTVHTNIRDWMFGLPHARHAREYTANELREIVRQAGFQLVSVEGRHFQTGSGRTSRLATLGKTAIDRLARVRPSFGSGLAVLACRPPT